ncbi:hypothetical protein V1524DRAFT_450245 [Lipomyces starkeyi]
MADNSPLPKPFNVAIVGGGIGGLCLAVGLCEEGVTVDIYESARAFAEIGARVAFGSNAANAMSLISPKVRGAYDRCATYNASPEKKNTWFDFRLGQGGELICEVKSPEGQSYLIPREIAHFGKRLVEYDDQDENGVLLKFDDGTTAKHYLGKDNPAAYPTFSGKYAYRGLIPMDKASKSLGDALARNSQVYVGHGGHVLTFPVEQGKTMNVVAFQTKTDGDWKDNAWVKPVEKQVMLTDFDQWGSSVKSIISLVHKPEVWALFDHHHAETFTRGHVCLLGDAAHATTPHQGSGAGMAVEVALILSNLLGMVDHSRDLKLVLQIYDQIRRPRTQKVVTTSRQAGLLYDMELPEVGDDLAKIADQLSTRMEWIWNEDLDAHVKAAKTYYQALSNGA